jgi:hypothetical protein
MSERQGGTYFGGIARNFRAASVSDRFCQWTHSLTVGARIVRLAPLSPLYFHQSKHHLPKRPGQSAVTLRQTRSSIEVHEPQLRVIVQYPPFWRGPR